MRVALALSAALVGTLSAACPALGHIGVTPGLVTVGETQTLTLSVHNDLDQPMTGLAVKAAEGTRVAPAGADAEWEAVEEDETATWTGGSLAANTGMTFALDVAVDASTPVGPVQLQAEQLYPGGGKLPWPISVTVVPADEESQLLTWAIVAGIVALVTGGIALIALQRRGRTLQER